MAYHNFVVMCDNAYIHVGAFSDHAILVHKDALQRAVRFCHPGGNNTATA